MGGDRVREAEHSPGGRPAGALQEQAGAPDAVFEGLRTANPPGLHEAPPPRRNSGLSFASYAASWPEDFLPRRELFYVDAEQRLVAVSVTANPDFSPGQSTPLFSVLGMGAQSNSVGSAYVYDVAPDGQRFLVCLRAGTATDNLHPVPLTVTTNWTSLLPKKLMTLSPGTRLGPYEITNAIGAGWRAGRSLP